METSDSECFESADEDFEQEDNNDRLSKNSNKPISTKSVKDLTVSESTKCIETESNSALTVSKNQAVRNYTKSAVSDESKSKDGKIDEKKEDKGFDKPVLDVDKFEVNQTVDDRNRDKSEKLYQNLDSIKDKTESSLQNKISNRLDPVVNDDDSGWGWDNDEIDEFTNLHIKPVSQKNPTSSSLSPTQNVFESNDDGDGWGWNEDDDWSQLESSHKLQDDLVKRKDSKVETNVTNQRNVSEDNSSSWSSWGNWGVSSLLSTASTLTNHVSQVIESGIGVPDPEELAKQNVLERQKVAVEEESEETSSSNSTRFGLTGFGSLVSGVNQITKLVETTGNKVIFGGLDTLETIGKKTMEVLQEGDPGLKRKRAFLHIDSDKPVLSQILREAKEKAENERVEEKRSVTRKRVNYETIFDDHQGLVHLEALEMLSRQCNIKLQTVLENMSGSELQEMQETLEQIKELCELSPEDDDETSNENTSYDEFEKNLNTATSDLDVPISYSKLLSTWIAADKWLDELDSDVCEDVELHEKSINILAQLTSLAVENYHKIGELLLVKEHRSTVNEADSLVQLTNILSSLIGNVSKHLSDTLNEKSISSQHSGSASTSELITNIYFEAANSTSYIRNSFQLLLPILQVGVL